MMIVTVKRTDIPYLSARQEVRIEQIYKVAFAALLLSLLGEQEIHSRFSEASAELLLKQKAG